MICNHCKKEFEAKRETAKYCSTSCRVMNNKRKQDIVPLSAIQVQVLYNAMIEMTENINDRLDKLGAYLGGSQRIMPNISATAPAQAFNGTIRKSVEQYITEKREILQESDWITLKEEINNDANLTAKQKLLIFTS